MSEQTLVCTMIALTLCAVLGLLLLARALNETSRDEAKLALEARTPGPSRS